MGSINIDGMRIEARNGRLFINGNEIDVTGSKVGGPPPVPVEVKLDKDGRFTGNISGDISITIEASDAPRTIVFEQSVGNVTVKGNGNITAERITGNVTTTSLGSVKADQIVGNVTAGGNVNAVRIVGNVIKR